MDYKNLLNEAQYKAVTATDNRLLFLAGAGVGKTHTMMYRTAYLVESGVDPKRILLLTFTNKAAAEMVERLEKLGIKGVTACTFHSFCVTKLREYAKYLGLENFTVLSESDQEETIRMFRPKKFPLTVSQIASAESFAINTKKSLSAAICHVLGHPVPESVTMAVGEVVQASRDYKNSHNMLSFDDLLTRFIYELRKNMAEPMRRQFTHVMVDEYQDTNKLQDEILDLINPENLAVVGDDCQSLYAFRGADVHNIIDFPKRHNCRTIKIERNYRSNQAILDLSNNMMKKYAAEGIPKWLTAHQAYGDAPRLERPENIMEEADLVLGEIKNHLKTEDPKEMCVLVRNARASSALEGLLTAERIPFEKRGGPKFFDLAHIKDVLSLFEITRHKDNTLAWFRVLMLIRNIGVVNARRIADELSIGISMDKYQKRAFYKDLMDLCSQMTERCEWRMRLDVLIKYYIKMRVKLVDSSNAQNESEQRLAIKTQVEPDLKLLAEIAKGYKSADEFLDDLLTSNVPSLEKEDEDKIIISTIHSAKGLEFDSVILMGTSEGIFPREYTDEELRCMYVALTRARKHLLITSPIWYMAKGNMVPTNVPVWLSELEDAAMF